MAEYGYTVIYEALSEGGYQVIVPALPGVVTLMAALWKRREKWHGMPSFATFEGC